MKIQIGIGSFRELDFYLKENCDELYCGLEYIPSHLEGPGNFSSTAEIIKASCTAHQAGKKFFFTANEASSGILKKTIDTIEELTDGGVDGVIARDLAVLEEIKKRRIKTAVILSTLSCCLNSAALDFYASYGISRLALPEQLMPEEAENIIKNRYGIKTEIFLKHMESCRNFNGLCFLPCKGRKGNFCKKTFQKNGLSFEMPHFGRETALSQFYRCWKLGAEIMKVGRCPAQQTMKLVFAEAKYIKELLGKRPSEKEFIDKTAEIDDIIKTYYKKHDRN